MKTQFAIFFLTACLGVPAIAQDQLPQPSAVEKDLAAKASDMTEVTLGKNMLGFASKFMNGKDNDEAATRQLIEGLDGIYVREYKFDKEGQYSMDQIEQLRKIFETPEWASIVRERERHNSETTDVLMKMVNGETRGLFVLEAEPKELTIVLILGPIRMDQLGMLRGLTGMDALADVERVPHEKMKEKGKSTDKVKDKTGGDQ